VANDFRVPMSVIFDAFGVDAIVTLPDSGSEPIETTVAWLAPDQVLNPIGLDDQRFQPNFQRRDPLLILALRKDDVESVPVGTRIVAPALDGDIDETWKVDGIIAQDSEHHKVAVLKVDDAT